MDQTSTDERQEFLKTGKSLDTWVEETVDVTVIKPEVDEKNHRISFKTDVEKQKQKVYYASAPSRMIICSKHFFLPENPKKYLFKCKNCDYHYLAQIPTHKYNPSTGELVYRKTGHVV